MLRILSFSARSGQGFSFLLIFMEKVFSMQKEVIVTSFHKFSLWGLGASHEKIYYYNNFNDRYVWLWQK